MSRLTRLFERLRPSRDSMVHEPASGRDRIRWVIVGLGNPGEQYRRSRHNLGFMVLDRVAARHGVKLNRRKFNGLYAEARFETGSMLLVKPQTFYNGSGGSALSILGYFKVPIDSLIVVHDDMDLAAGQIRLRRGGSDAGNHGVRSIIESLGQSEFIRVRIGIGHPDGNLDSIGYVLKPLSASEKEEFEPALERAVDAVATIIRDGLQRAMNLYNQRG